MFSLFGWPYDTTSAMARLVFSGIMEQFPGLKVVTHHLGGMVPFYADTAIYGNTKALECGHEFFGPDRIVFGIDFPLGDIENGDRNYRQTINAIDAMNITEEDKKKIYEDNARKLMRLPI